MITIAILDDKLEEAQRIKDLLMPYFDKRNVEVDRIDICTNGSQLLHSKKEYDLLFLDIEVGSENGIDIAKQLRLQQPNVMIIVVTSFIQYSIEGYKIQAARYLLKPVPAALLYSELDEVLQTMVHDQYIVICDAREERRLRIQDIYYFESYGRKTQFHLRVEAYISKESVSHWAENLHQQFVECYKGMYVNVKYIEQVGRDCIQLDNKQILPLARRRIDEVKEAWMCYQEMIL